MGQAAITAAQGTYAQLQSIGLTSATVGVTPMVILIRSISPTTDFFSLYLYRLDKMILQVKSLPLPMQDRS